MTSLIYSTGTVSVTNGSATVTGNLTGWAVALVTGGLFSCAGIFIPIASVESDTSLTLAYAWPGSTASGEEYAIARDTSEATRATWTNDRLADIIQRLSLVGIHPDGAGTLAQRNALSPVPATGYIWLRVEPGFDLEIYRKTASGWEGPFALRGHGGVGTGGLGLPSPGAANQVPFYSAPGTISLTSLTSYARGLLGASNGADLQDAMGINILRDYAVNLIPDSGRFAGNAANGTTVGAFEFPSYLTLYNGTTVESAGKFIHNNTDYGGAAGNLAAVVKNLVDKIRGPSYRRFGVEFHVAQFTMGSGTAGAALNIGGTNYYLSLFPTTGPMVPGMTFHAYVRALDAPIAMQRAPGQTFIRDGVRSTTHQVIAPADGWVSMTIHHQVNPYESVGYQPDLFQFRCSASGHRYLLACPAVMGGITDVDDNVGVISGINRWLPVIERGSNANGEYARFVDGTQICWAAQTVNFPISTAAGAWFRSGAQTWTFPAAFSAPPILTALHSSQGDNVFDVMVQSSYSISATSGGLVWVSSQSKTAANRTFQVAAIGRWF